MTGRPVDQSQFNTNFAFAPQPPVTFLKSCDSNSYIVIFAHFQLTFVHIVLFSTRLVLKTLVWKKKSTEIYFVLQATLPAWTFTPIKMADKEDESNMTAGAEEGESTSAAPLHRVAGLAHSGDPVVPDSTHNASSNGEELTSAVKDSAENPVIGEYFQGSVEKGAELGQDDQVASPTAGDGLLLERHIITSFIETPGIETVTTADLSSVNSELVDTSSEATTTIIYVQPDGSFVEGTGLTAEEQRQLVEQLAQQQLVEVTENEAARLFQQQRPPTSHFSHGGALAPNELQQVIDQVSRSQQSVAQVELHGGPAPAQRQEQVPAVSEQLPGCISLPPGCVLTAASPAQDAAVRPPPLCIVQNASQQLQNVAKQVALQQSQSNNGTRLIQKKVRGGYLDRV